MEKKLPKIFANDVNKELNNNKKIYRSNEDEKKEETDNIKTDINIYTKPINQKINEILKTKKYVYKIPVKIKTNKTETIKYIIGKNNKNLITMENELIKIDDILDINIIEESK